ncbi:hypothetical protein ACF064_36760 [Streptomyces sp. NPDC015492]|uniref:hypothetical protein n=1 Tax=Streptomyces sp. NPDC015492 TaxID=3364958 RepID=UPI0036FBEEF1
MNTRAWIVFLDESGVSLLPQVRRTYPPRGRTPLLRHRLNWKRASMAGALGYHAADPDRGPRLCFHLKPGSYDTAALTGWVRGSMTAAPASSVSAVVSR